MAIVMGESVADAGLLVQLEKRLTPMPTDSCRPLVDYREESQYASLVSCGVLSVTCASLCQLKRNSRLHITCDTINSQNSSVNYNKDKQSLTIPSFLTALI